MSHLLMRGAGIDIEDVKTVDRQLMTTNSGHVKKSGSARGTFRGVVEL